MISSISNTQIQNLIKLQKQVRFRRKQQLFVAEGMKMLREAAWQGKLKRIYATEEKWDVWQQEMPVDKGKFDYELVSDAVFKQISETVTPQGILGLVSIPTYALQDILKDGRHHYLLLDDIRDPGNLGTIMRTAEGAGMSGIILSRECVDLFNPKVVRSTMGAIFRVPYCYVESLPEVVRQIRKLAYEVYGTAMEGSVIYDEPDYTKGAAVVIGNEANGISPAVFQEISGRIRIPMEGQLESLNAAVSASIIMYEINRQSRKLEKPL